VGSDYEEIAERLAEAFADLERMALEEQLPDKERQRERASALKKMGEALAFAQEMARRQRAESQFAGVLHEIHTSNKELLAAINKNTAATNKILATADTRLAHLELSVTSNDGTAFPADPRVLEEGALLRTHLTGLLDTERPGPLFNDALPQPTPGGFDDLTTAICTTCNELTELE
jgi:hypothetical protein